MQLHSDESWHKGQVWAKLTAQGMWNILKASLMFTVSQNTVIYDGASTNCMNAYATFCEFFVAETSTLKDKGDLI